MYSIDRDNGDGSHTMIVYQDPINYFENGEWKPINTTITRIGDIYGVETGLYKAYFHADHVRIVRNSGTVDRYFLGTSDTQNDETVLEIDGNRATYRNGVDVEYVYTETGLKQNAILRHRPKIDCECYVVKEKIVFDEDVYAFVGGRMMSDAFTTQQELTFKNRNNEKKCILPAAYSFEYNNPDESVVSDYGVLIERNTVFLSVRCPMCWLSDPERTYPVVIDDTDDSATNNGDAQISSGRPAYNYGGSTIGRVGYLTSSEHRVVMNWTLPAGSGTITEISLNLFPNGWTGTDSYNVEVHELTPTNPDKWVEGTQDDALTNGGVTWSYKFVIIPLLYAWSTSGGDYSATVVDERSAADLKSYAWKTWCLYGSPADNPMSITWADMFDVILLSDESPKDDDDSVTFRMKEYSGTDWDPYVRVTYTPAVAVFPSFLGTLGLVIGCGLLLLVSRQVFSPQS